MPKSRTPRDLLLAALERRRLTGFRASRDAAWVVFPPRHEGGELLAVVHVPRANRFRVVSSQTQACSTAAATTLGNFRSSEAAAACVEAALNEQGAPAERSDAGHGQPRGPVNPATNGSRA